MINSLQSLIFFALTTSSLLLGAAFAQTPAQPAKAGISPAGHEQSALVLHYYKPSEIKVDLDELVDAATRIFGRSIAVRSEDGTVQQSMRFFRLGNSIAVYDTAASAKRILEELPKMARAANEISSSTEEWELTEVKLKHLRADQLVRSLRNLVPEPAVSRRRSRTATTTLGARPEPFAPSPNNTSIIIRGNPENTQRIKDLIAKLDVPKPTGKNVSVALDIWVLSGDANDRGATDGEAPKSLMSHLLPLFPGKELNLIGRGLVATKIGGKDIRLTQTLTETMTAELTLSSIDEGTAPNSVTISSLDFELVKRVEASIDAPRRRSSSMQPYRIRTAAELTVGEYTVIASFGASPYMLVVRPRWTP